MFTVVIPDEWRQYQLSTRDEAIALAVQMCDEGIEWVYVLSEGDAVVFEGGRILNPKNAKERSLQPQ